MVDFFQKHNKYKPLEFFLMLEGKGYIQIVDIHINQNSNQLKWDLTINVLRTWEEVNQIEKEWVSFGKLHFRPVSGHARHGDYEHVFQKQHKGFKLLNDLLRTQNYECQVQYLAIDILGEPKNTDKKKCLSVIHDVVHQTIKPKLGLKKDGTTIDILIYDGKCVLTAVPSNKE
ncbi:hypothetical protein DID80_04915 [Candidatus Marinamargulisbacteria bacterium SCGC AAA071-K20]|nr:hypothetical protein DID80_04915 [Candidatus Marinamargulisbacteria bacterium SCGC AAA071-K20]